jgi:hypothetical protein
MGARIGAIAVLTLALALALTSCGKPTNTVTVTASVTVVSTVTTAVPLSAPELKAAMDVWEAEVSGHISDADDAINSASTAIHNKDVAALKSSCQQLNQAVVVDLQNAMPSPDPATNTALTKMIADTQTSTASCGNISNPPPAADLDAMSQYLHIIGDDFTNIRNIAAQDDAH